MNKVLFLSFAAAASLAVSHTSIAEEGQWKYSTGVDYSTGDYGGDPVDTDIVYVPFTTAYSSGLWEFKATIPWVQIKGAGTVIGAGGGGVVVGDPDLVATTESGVGDIWLSATYSVEAIPSELFYLDIAGKLKVPTADDDKGLGTGELDYTVQADVFKSFNAVTPFATLAYKIKSDFNETDLKNVIYLSVGSDYRLSAKRNVGVSIDFQEASSSAGDDSMELFGYLNQKLNSHWSATLYGYKGLKDGNPDYGTGLQVSYKP